MNSLRSRLILGVAFVALVPLALSMYLLSRRVEITVRDQAAERLNAALGRLAAGLAADGERIAGKLEILARDPVLKRLYLVRPAGGRELSEQLAEKRFLLGIDFLHLADAGGVVIADAADLAMGPASTDRPALDARALPARGAHGAIFDRLPGGDALVMASSAPVRYEGRVVGHLRGGIALDAGFLGRLKDASGVDLILTGADGRLVASTLADAASDLPPVADGRAAATPGGEAVRVALGGSSYWSRVVALGAGAHPGLGHDTSGSGAPSRAPGASERPPSLPRITGLVSTAAADRSMEALQLTSFLLGLLGLGVAIVLGVLWSSQVSRPVERLAAFSQRIARGEWDEPLRLRSVRELQTLVAAFERMRADLGSYRERLVTSERHAAWGQMARKVAHEIKNPLTPIAVSVADLQRSFERNREDFPQILDQAARTIAAEVEALKRILQEFSDFARLPEPELAPVSLAGLLGDLEALYRREVHEGRLGVAAPGRDVLFTADRGQMLQALVNLVQNGLEAIGPGGRVDVSAKVEGAELELRVSDDGPGMTPDRKADLFVPGLTTKAHGSGLGLVIVQRIVNEHGGSITAETAPGQGTTFRVRLRLAGPRE